MKTDAYAPKCEVSEVRNAMLRTVTTQSGRVNGFPSFAQDEGRESKSATESAHGLFQMAFTLKADAAESALCGYDYQLSFPARQPRHHNGSG